MFRPDDPRMRTRWQQLLAALILASCVLIPFQVAFVHEVELLGSLIVYAIDAFFAADVWLRLRADRNGDRETSSEERESRRRSGRGPLLLDLLAAAPIDVALLPWQDVAHPLLTLSP